MRAASETLRVDLPHSSLQMTVWPADRRLRPHLACLEHYAEDAHTPYSRTHVAMPRVAVLMELGEPMAVQARRGKGAWLRAPGGYAAGLSDAPAATRHQGPHRGLQVDLSPLAARQLFDVPLSELRGRTVPLADLLPRDFATLLECLGEPRETSTSIDRLEAYLIRRLGTARPPSPRVAGAVARIEALGGRLDVGSLAPWLGISHKHLIALFHDQVGVSPKLFARLVRHERALAAAHSHPEWSWAEIALRGGYYDQSHLHREVRAFTGATPTAARARSEPGER